MIYLNNGATSWPKPPAVSEAVHACFAVPGRQLDHEKRCGSTLPGKIGTAPWNQGNRENNFYIRGNRKHEYSPWGAGLR